eukprot:CAMPEP_0118885734 /NCGR_PEP_ID=MMETSP1163-20130328/24087_1 /TAXON_ID=124430 /ORGANISM="Phaeomonas parva, Strain CCMP2877" /LENGTH=96 /DNA_ID=CAMNT_0006823799 /DNA_START=112 /DNA_END=402 /DNA_ORIENTATION=-
MEQQESISSMAAQLEVVETLIGGLEDGVAREYLKRIQEHLDRNQELLAQVAPKMHGGADDRLGAAPALNEVNQNVAEVIRSLEALSEQVDLRVNER